MECCRQHIFLFHQRRFSLMPGKHGNFLSHFFNNWPADEHHLQRLLLQSTRLEKDVTRQLPPVAIPQNRHVQQAKRFLCRILPLGRQQNRPCARAENRAASPRKLLDGVKQSFFLQELQLRCGFSAGQHDPVAPFQILHRAHFHRFRAQLLQHGRMRREITLYRHNSNLHGSLLLSLSVRMTRPDAYGLRRTPPGRFLSRNNLPATFDATLQSPPYHPRVESKSFASNCGTSIPGIATPSSSHASRIAFASSKCVVAFTMAFARASGSLLLKMPEPTNTASAPSFRTSAASAGVAIPPAEKFGTGNFPVFAISRIRSSGAPISFAVRINSSSRSLASLSISQPTLPMCPTPSTTFPNPSPPS